MPGTMPSVQQSILALQTTDLELDACRRRIRVLQTELAHDPEGETARAALDAAQAELAAAQAAVRDGEQTMERLTQTIAMLEKRLYDGSIHTAREAASVEEELAHRRADRGATEDAVFAAMERVEAAQAAEAAARVRLTAAETARAARVPSLKAEGRAAVARSRELQERRAALAAAAPPALLGRYDRLRAVTSPAVTQVHAGNCGACGVSVPTSLLQRIAADEIVECQSCNRILTE